MRGDYLETWSTTGVWPDSVQVSGEALSRLRLPAGSSVWLSHGLRCREAPREKRLERGLSCSR
jgi:hypothetical protein